jgi:uncharacterized membrane protein YbjE (DUF340 family)
MVSRWMMAGTYDQQYSQYPKSTARLFSTYLIPSPPMSDMWITTGFVFGFALLGYLAINLSSKSGITISPRIVHRVSWIVLCLLIFSMGISLGAYDNLLPELANLGITAGLLGICTSLGSILFAALIVPGSLLPGLHRSDKESSSIIDTQEINLSTHQDKPVYQKPNIKLEILKEPMVFLSCLVLGVLVSVIFPILGKSLSQSSLSSIILYFLLFFAGAAMAIEHKTSKSFDMSWKLILLPGITIVGTLAGSILVALILGTPVFPMMAAGSGFGWYSLSGILISDLGNPALGSASFLGNLGRELIALMVIPLLGNKFPGSAIACAGATSMDVTLPIIGKTAGYRYVSASMYHGTFLSFLVPVLVPLFIGLG